MTRIALCYSGRPRSILECHENHKQHFRLGQNDVDVFAHLWFDESLVGSQFRSDVVKELGQMLELKIGLMRTGNQKRFLTNVQETLSTCSLILGGYNGTQLTQKIIRSLCSMVLSKQSN